MKVVTALLGIVPNVALAQQPRMLNVGDASIRYEVEGQGPAIVFVHGWAQDLSIWDEQARVFAPNYRVIRFDRRGFGQSKGLADPSADAADLLALLDTLGLRTAHIVGLSAGARTALDFAAAYPTRASALVYYGGAPMPGFPGMPNEMTAQTIFGDIARAHGVDTVRKLVLASPLFWDPPNRPDLTVLKEQMMAKYAGRDLLQERPESRRVPRAQWSQLAELTLPTLIVNGDHDFPNALVAADSMTKKMPNARRVVITNAGHGAHFAQPAQFNAALSNFFGSLRR